MASAYHEGMRRLQDRFETRRLADRLAELRARTSFTEDDRDFIQSRRLFFLATADGEGRPDCSFKAGDPGFVRVTADNELAFPSYDGNGMFRSLGNVLVNPAVALLFVDFETPRRLRVNGLASLDDGDPLLAQFTGAQLVVRVRRAHFPELPALHPTNGARRAFRLRAPRGPHAAGAAVEKRAGIPRGAACRRSGARRVLTNPGQTDIERPAISQKRNPAQRRSP